MKLESFHAALSDNILPTSRNEILWQVSLCVFVLFQVQCAHTHTHTHTHTHIVKVLVDRPSDQLFRNKICSTQRSVWIHCMERISITFASGNKSFSVVDTKNLTVRTSVLHSTTHPRTEKTLELSFHSNWLSSSGASRFSLST